MTRPLRVAYLPAILQPGGAERQMLALAERLPPDRFAVSFVALSGPGEYDARAERMGAQVRHIGLPPSPNTPWPANLMRIAGKAFQYATVVRRERYDILDAWLYPSDVLAALMGPLTRRPIVISGRRNIDPQDRFGRIERPVRALSGALTDAVVANSAAAAAYAIEHQGVDPRKVRIIRNGVELIDPIGPDERAVRRAAMGAAPDEIVIGCVANYRPVKRPELLIDAFGSLVQEGHRVRLVIVGDGPLRPSLERQIHELGLDARVRLHGSTPDPRALYGAFDVAVQTSSREGLPNALLEAAAAGRAIVATDAGGSAEIVVNGRTGLIVPLDDREALVRALRVTITDGGLRDRLGSAAREHVAKTFGMDRFVEEFATLYETLAASRKPTG